MRWLRWMIGGALVAALGLGVVMRQLPRDFEDVHFSPYPSAMGHTELTGAHVFRTPQREDGGAQMRAWAEVVLATPRTLRVAGSVEEGRVTYMTRSKVFGFPDFITLERDVDLIETATKAIAVVGTTRYGVSDLGVNRRRIEGWLAQIEAGG